MPLKANDYHNHLKLKTKAQICYFLLFLSVFFLKNPDILLYMCDTANEQQAQRDRLFLRWFNAYEQKKKYVIKTAVVYDEGIPNYVSLIVPIEHPLLEDIQATFESEIIMFQNNK